MSMVSSYTIATVLSLQTLCTCILFTLGQFIYAFYLQTYALSGSSTPHVLNVTTTTATSQVNSSQKCPQIGGSQDNRAQAWAQQQSADLFLWTNVWSCCPIIIMTYILGLYTPKLGRRFVLILPMIGIAAQLMIWLAIIYFHLPEYWWYIAAFIVGLSGSDNVRNFVLNLLITENSVESERSSRFVVFGGISMIVSAIGTFAIGYYIAWQGFTDLYWAALILQLISISIVIFYFRTDTHHYKPLITSDHSQLTDPKTSSITCSSFLDACRVFSFNNRSRKKSLSLLFTLLAYASYCFICTAFTILLLYLLNAPFCWSSQHIGNFSATALITFGTLSVLGMKVLTKLGACDITTCIISHVFFCLTSLWLAFAENDWQMYMGLLLSSFSGYQNFLTLSMISKWLHPSERTSAFTLVTEINTIMKVLGYCFFNWIYARTVMANKNFTFLLAAGLSIFPLAFNICLWYVSRWMPDEEDVRDEEMDLVPVSRSVPVEWTTSMANANPLLVPQQFSDISRTSSISSSDYRVANNHDSDYFALVISLLTCEYRCWEKRRELPNLFAKYSVTGNDVSAPTSSPMSNSLH